MARRSFILEKTPRQRVRSTRLLGSRKRLTKFDGAMTIKVSILNSDIREPKSQTF